MEHTHNLAHRGKRFVAFLIDAIIIGFINGIFSGYNMDGYNYSNTGSLSSLIGALYSIIFWLQWNGQTPGKRVMGIMIVKEDGSKFTVSDAIMRYVGYIISGVALMIGFIWILFDSKKQGWHDKIAKTLVVSANK
jgi:uncharacterized RDD family membrane protein YckC